MIARLGERLFQPKATVLEPPKSTLQTRRSDLMVTPPRSSRETASHPGQTKVTKRCRLTSTVMPLDDCKIYIGRGSSKFHLQPSMWRNPYRIGADGTRDDCVRKFEDHLTSSPDLLEVIHTLRGKTLVCHCGDHAMVTCLSNMPRPHREPTPGAEDDATIDEENGQQKPKRGAGWWGHGCPLRTGRGSRHREINDGGGLCSPGRWAPSRRKLPLFAAKVTEALETVVVEIAAQEGEGYWSRVVCSLACGKVDTDPLEGCRHQSGSSDHQAPRNRGVFGETAMPIIKHAQKISNFLANLRDAWMIPITECASS